MKIKRIDILQTELIPARHTLAKAVRLALCAGGSAMMLSISPIGLSQSTFSAVLELSDLDGSDGFVLNGTADAGDYSGRSVSGAGDLNGDGVDDLIIGAFMADPNGSSSGESYVVFGGGGVGTGGVLELSSLDGSDGFALNGIDVFDRSGQSVSGAGDLNGDGVDDLCLLYTSPSPRD